MAAKKHDFHSEITRSLDVSIEDGTAYQAIIWFKDKDDKHLALYESDECYLENRHIEYKFNIATLAEQLSVKEEDLSYLNLGIKIDHDDPKIAKGEIIRADIRPSDKVTQLYITSLPPKEYTVKKGDTLSDLAAEFGLSCYLSIADVNDINPPYTIYPKQVLKIPLRSKPLPQERKLDATKLILGSEVEVTVKGTPYAKTHIEIQHNKQTLLSFDIKLSPRGEALKVVKLRPKDDNEYKALIKTFAPQVGEGIKEEKLTLHAYTEGKNYKNIFDTDDMNTLSLSYYQTYIKSAHIIDQTTNTVVRDLKTTIAGNEVVFLDSETGEPTAKAPLDEITNAFGNINNGLGGLAAGMEYVTEDNPKGTFAMVSSKGLNFNYYENGWHGNQYVKTYSMAKWGKILGDRTFELSLVIGVYQIGSAMNKDEAYLDENNISKPDFLPDVGEQTEQQIGSTGLGFAGGVATTAVLGIVFAPFEVPALVILGSSILIGGAVGWTLSNLGDKTVEGIQYLMDSTIIHGYPLKDN